MYPKSMCFMKCGGNTSRFRVNRKEGVLSSMPYDKSGLTHNQM